MRHPRSSPSPTAAQLQAQAINDVERLAGELYETSARLNPGQWMPWRQITGAQRSLYLRTIEDMLVRGVIRVGERPQHASVINGQTTIEEALR